MTGDCAVAIAVLGEGAALPVIPNSKHYPINLPYNFVFKQEISLLYTFKIHIREWVYEKFFSWLKQHISVLPKLKGNFLSHSGGSLGALPLSLLWVTQVTASLSVTFNSSAGGSYLPADCKGKLLAPCMWRREGMPRLEGS